MGPAFFVPLALSALSAGGEYENQQQANNRAQTAETQNIINQQGYRNQANAQTNALTHQVAQDNTAPLASAATEQYINELRKNAAGAMAGGATGDTQTFGQPVSANPTVGNFSSRYKGDTAANQQEVQNYGTTAAGQLGQIDAAVRQRQNEGLGMQSLGTNLNLLNTESWGQNFVNQLRAQAAGTPNPGVALGAGILGGAGQGASKNIAPGTTWGQYFGSGSQPSYQGGIDENGDPIDQYGNPI